MIFFALGWEGMAWPLWIESKCHLHFSTRVIFESLFSFVVLFLSVNLHCFYSSSRWSNMCWNEDDTLYARQALRGKSESFSGNAFQFILCRTIQIMYIFFSLFFFFFFSSLLFHKDLVGLFLFSHSLCSVVVIVYERALYTNVYLFDTTAPFLA